LRNKQLQHEDTVLQTARTSVIVVCDHITSPANAGAIIRLCDAFGVKELFFCGREINLASNRLKRTSRSAEKNVVILQNKNIVDLLLQLQKKEYRLVGLEITSKSKPIQKFYERNKDTVLVLGSEKNGIDEQVLLLLDETLHITMFGKNSSMNVGHAAAIALYEITNPHPHEN